MPGRILIVDDNPDILSLLSDYFQTTGYQVDSASTGYSAFDFIHQFHYELIITDINMPELDGFDIITHIRANEKNKTTPILAISGVTDIGLTHKLSLLGINTYLKKPFSLDELTRSVTRLLSAPSDPAPAQIDANPAEQVEFLRNQYQKVLDEFNNYIQTSTNIVRVLDLNELAFSLMTYADIELGLNQSVFWVIDEKEKLIRPVRAVGPANEEEHQSNLRKLTSLSVEDILKEYHQESDLALNRQIQSLVFPLDEDHIFRRLIQEQQNQPVMIHHNLKDTPYNRLLVDTFHTDEFILIPIGESKG
ncbi:MAG: response regulator, partial [Candidatus Delongbacteria bacterium]|nr:response regulator [Candidatus Delongbacteria bacterium]